MRLNYKESVQLAKELKRKIKNTKNIVAVAPDFLVLPEIAKIIKGSSIKLASQDSFFANTGAETGEVSPLNLKKLGVRYAIIGHSERRALGETDKVINLKIKTALADGLIPVLCVGEKKYTKNPGPILSKQLNRDLQNIKLTKNQKLLIAYEPVWAISSTKNSRVISLVEIKKAHEFLQAFLQKFFGRVVFVKQLAILYGGSVDSNNISQFRGVAGVHGFLVGSASLRANDFVKIISSSKAN